LCELGADQRRQFHEALLDADSFRDLRGKWQAAVLTAERTAHGVLGGEDVGPDPLHTERRYRRG
jgi:hypothetical protein